ncbi:MAG: sensor histidine kinase [Pseudopedobacter saltans]|uniref:histidine kinase n=1 Tax=Pseudopedobacter saltans TaxID=151895 RepID=A0A2W5F9F6_9SPHI|nr:MAG: sensor histidine kinase [Pseudopedobacter saltans]
MSTYSRLRKNISISLVLVGLSVIGFFVLQVSWVYNTKETQFHRLLEDVGRASSELADQLSKQKNIQTSLHRPTQPQGLRIPNVTFDLTPPSLVADHFTYDEVSEQLREALKRHDVGGLQVDFAIYNGSRFIEMNSPNYVKSAALSNIDSTVVRFSIPISSSNNLSMMGSEESISIILPNFNKEVWKSMTWSLVSFALFTVVILGAFYLTVRNMLEQGQLSKTKTDFINNMTHEFKTPIATISLAIDAIRNPKVQNDESKMEYFSGIIKEENKRMNKHVETILQAAKMEKQELNLNIVPVHVHEVIAHIAEAFELQLESKNGVIEQHLKAENDLIYADETHFNNLINNLVDNAVKYSNPDVPPLVKISTSNSSRGVVIRVLDNGIGMSKETVKHVFDRFYRAHTGNVHNVKGFGLGMSYVKQIVEAHEGKIKVDSTLGKGSIFVVEMPFNIKSASKGES